MLLGVEARARKALREGVVEGPETASGCVGVAREQHVLCDVHL